MKTLLFLLASITIQFGNILLAQPTVSPGKEISQASIERERERIMMYKGNVWHRTNGVSILVDDDVEIAGIKVQADGTVIFQNNTTAKLKEGDFIESNGKVYKIFN